jgi:hypothetical protein
VQTAVASSRTWVVALAGTLALALAACGGDDSPAPPDRARPPEPTTTTATTATTAPQTAPRTQDPPTGTTAEPAFPAELVGTWVSTGQGAAELIYEFAGDGSYRHAGVLVQEREDGTFSFERGTHGTATVDADTLVLRQRGGTQTIKDPDVPEASSERELGPARETYRWRLDDSDGTLQLTDATGTTIAYERQ